MAEKGITVIVPLGQYSDRRFGILPEKYSRESMEKYVSKTVKKIIQQSPKYRNLTFSSIYIGGCEPSLLTLDQLYRILQTLYDHLSIIPNEQTIITSPGAVDAYRAKVLKELSFDHITIRIINKYVPVEDFDIFRNAGFYSVGFEVYLPQNNTFQPEIVEEIIRLKPDHLYFLPPTYSFFRHLTLPDFKEFLPCHYALPGKETSHLLKLNNPGHTVTFGISR